LSDDHKELGKKSIFKMLQKEKIGQPSWTLYLPFWPASPASPAEPICTIFGT